MAESREMAGAAAEASRVCADYLLRASGHAARTLHLFEQVVGCVGRGQLAPGALQDALTTFLKDRGAAAAAAGQATARFLATLASTTCLPDPEANPTVEANAAIDPVRWLEAALPYAAARQAEALAGPQAHMAGLAAGTIAPAEVRRVLAAMFGRGLAAQLGAAARLWFALLGDLAALRASHADEYLLGALRQASPIGFDGPLVVDLRAPHGGTARRVIGLENAGEERAQLACAAGEVRRADGVGPAFLPAVALSPPELLVDGGGEADIDVSLVLDETMYEEGAAYVGALQILRDGVPTLDLPLRVTVAAKDPR